MLLLLIGGIILTLVIAYCVIGNNVLTSYGDETAQAALSTASKATRRFLDEKTAVYSAVGRAIAADKALAVAIAEKDIPFIKAYAQRVNALEGINLVTIIDADTTVLARGHTENAGDKPGFDRVSAALPLKEGKAVFGMDTDCRSAIVLAAATPLLLDGQPVGAAVIGLKLTPGAFVDSIKKTLGVECTIFLDDVRYTTTVMRDGIPLVGTRLENEYIYNKVMNEGETLITRNKIAGMEYDTIYWPWEDMSGKRAGMFFIGQSRAELMNSQRTVIYSFIIAGCIFGSVIFLLGGMTAGVISSLSNAEVDATAVRLTADLAPIRAQQRAVRNAAAHALDIAGRLAAAVEDLSGRIEQSARDAETLKEITGFAGANETIGRIVNETAHSTAQSSIAVRELSRMAQDLNGVMEQLQNNTFKPIQEEFHGGNRIYSQYFPGVVNLKQE
jgi:methyl-accepting chemotaxis protein